MNIKIDFIGKDGIEETGSYNWDVVPQVGDIAKVRDPGGVFVYSDVVHRTFDFTAGNPVVRITVKPK